MSLEAELSAGGVLSVKSWTVTMDDSWTPYIQATLNCHATPELVACDPTDGNPRAVLTMELDGVTRTLDLAVQKVRDLVDGTVLVELNTDEQRLMEYRRVASDAWMPSTGSLRELIQEVLDEIGLGILDTDGPYATVSLDAAWTPGQSAHDFLNPMVVANGMRLWCDESGLWHLDPNPRSTSGSIVVDVEGETMTDYAAERNRDTHYDAVVITYKWTDVLGDDYVAYDTAAETGFSHVYAETRDDTPFPGEGAAASLLRRLLTRGRRTPVEAKSDYSVNPGMTAVIRTPSQGWQAGWITSVTWSDQGLMTIDTRDTREITEHAWLFDAPGVSWLEVPVGVSWTEDV